MQVVSELLQINNFGDISTEYVESVLDEKNIKPLRWAIVEISEKIITVNVSYCKE